MIEHDIFSTRKKALLSCLNESIINALPHSKAFAIRVSPSVRRDHSIEHKSFEKIQSQIVYGGTPNIAELGYFIGSNPEISKSIIELFLYAVERLQQREPKGLQQLLVDDIAILGLADGLSNICEAEYKERVEILKVWLSKQILNRNSSDITWTCRIKDLSIDLLTDRGLLGTKASVNPYDETNFMAVELVLRQTWPMMFAKYDMTSRESSVNLLSSLIKDPLPEMSETELLVIWLQALDILIHITCDMLFPNNSLQHEINRLVFVIKTNIDKIAAAYAKRTMRFINYALLGVLIGTPLILKIYLIPSLGWNNLEPYTYLLGFIPTILSYLFFVITLKEYSPREFQHLIAEYRKKKLYKLIGYNLEMYDRLFNENIKKNLSISDN